MQTPVSKEQQALLKAVRLQQVAKVRSLLEDDFVDPDFPSTANTTPLLEAVRKGNISIVRMLVEAGANVNGTARAGIPPLKMAEDLSWDMPDAAVVAKYLKANGAVNKHFSSQSRRKNPAPARKGAAKKSVKGPVFTVETLPEVFDAKKWVGQLEKMQQEWEKVPPRLKKKFNFAAALSEARQKTLKSHAPGKAILKKKDVPPPKAT